MPSICERCCQPSPGLSMSFFNEDMCCLACLEEEQLHPQYAQAKREELKAVQRGNYNFPGIGLPVDFFEVIQSLRSDS